MTRVENDKHHFFASNFAEWRTDPNIEPLIKEFKKQKLDFALYYVPLPESAHYEIRFFAPHVEGTILLDQYLA